MFKSHFSWRHPWNNSQLTTSLQEGWTGIEVQRTSKPFIALTLLECIWDNATVKNQTVQNPSVSLENKAHDKQGRQRSYVFWVGGGLWCSELLTQSCQRTGSIGMLTLNNLLKQGQSLPWSKSATLHAMVENVNSLNANTLSTAFKQGQCQPACNQSTCEERNCKSKSVASPPSCECSNIILRFVSSFSLERKEVADVALFWVCKGLK